LNQSYAILSPASANLNRSNISPPALGRDALPRSIASSTWLETTESIFSRHDIIIDARVTLKSPVSARTGHVVRCAAVLRIWRRDVDTGQGNPDRAGTIRTQYDAARRADRSEALRRQDRETPITGLLSEYRFVGSHRQRRWITLTDLSWCIPIRHFCAVGMVLVSHFNQVRIALKCSQELGEGPGIIETQMSFLPG